MVEDVEKGETHVQQKKDQQEKDPVRSNCSDTGSKKKKSFEKSWRWKGAIQNAVDLSRWTCPQPVRDLHDSPVTLFELFMTDKLIDRICKETSTYAAQKE